MVTTLLCMVPPSGGYGWQITTVPCRADPASGTSTATSSLPAGPASAKLVPSDGKLSGAFTSVESVMPPSYPHRNVPDGMRSFSITDLLSMGVLPVNYLAHALLARGDADLEV